MNKKKLLIILGVIVLGVILILFVPIGNKDYKSDTENIILKVPRFSVFKEECCMTSANFTSIRGSVSLKIDIENYLNELEKISCNGDTYYYDEEQDFTITEYHITNNILYRNFNFVFSKGKYCDEELETNVLNGIYAPSGNSKLTRIQFNEDYTFTYIIHACTQYYDEVILNGMYEIKANDIILTFNKEYKTNEEQTEGIKYENDTFQIKDKDTIIHNGYSNNCGYDGVNNTKLIKIN